MLQNSRYEKILHRLRMDKGVQVALLAEELNISESTIRRDITELDRMGQLKKVFGGAVSLESDIGRNGAKQAPQIHSRSAEAKININTEEKERIAKYAATLIEDSDFVFIDAGTTTEKLIDYLENKNITYVTNGITHLRKLTKRGFKAYIIGGQLKIATEALVGTEAVESLRKYNFTKCFMGANGIDLERGFTTPDIDEAMVKSEAMKQSQISYMLVDHTKFGQTSSVTFADLDKGCIITDQMKNENYFNETDITLLEPDILCENEE
ncbi:MAG: DeoR/GlpR family DNA-binding transcription regulator [Anaerovoracaceae bacterium]